MGYTAILMVNVDELHVIKEDKEFGKKVSDAVLKYSCYKGTEFDKDTININPGATVVGCEHADCVQVVATGPNGVIKLSDFWHIADRTDDKRVDIIRALAAKYGFTLHKKPDKTKKNGTEVL